VIELRARGHGITRVDLGGGLGISYRVDDVVPTLDAYAAMVARVTRDWDVDLIFEPGRVVAGIIPVDALGRLIEEIEPEDELEIIRDREFGVDGLELWVDVVLAAAASVVELDVG
jgi:hypothetical protein